MTDGSHAIEGKPEPEQTGWFHRHRFRIVIWIAVIEGLLVWATHGFHLVTIIVLGVIAFAFLMLHRFTTERTRSPLLGDITWFLAASQLGATVLAAAGFILIPALVILLVVFALVALGLLLLDRR